MDEERKEEKEKRDRHLFHFFPVRGLPRTRKGTVVLAR
jgi:hypothetical protein